MNKIISETMIPPLSAYGRQGDRSLEYVGLTVDRAAKTIKSRIYRRDGSDTPFADRLSAPYRDLFARFAPFTALPGVQLCDVSDGRRDGAVTQRLIFKLPKHMDRAQETAVAEAFFAAAGAGPGLEQGVRTRLYARLDAGCTLYQLGAECAGKDVCAFKYYLHAAPERIPGGVAVPDAVQRDHAAICENGFKPAFIGVNDDGTAAEEKLYYITKALGFKTAWLADNMKRLSAALGLDALLSAQVLDEMLEAGLYLEGLALSLQEEDRVRLYFTELK